MSTKAPSYSPSATLGIRVEFIRQIKRRRTLVSFLLVIALPLIVVAAVTLGPSADGNGGGARGGGGFGDGGLDLIGLATSGAWNFTLTMLLFSSGFLLLIIAAMFMGDTVASEASWSTLRYLLVAPVPAPAAHQSPRRTDLDRSGGDHARGSFISDWRPRVRHRSPYQPTRWCLGYR